MEIENLPEKVKKAKEAVESLEEPLKTEAFKKILDKLLENTPVIQFPKESPNYSKPPRKIKVSKKGNLGKAGIRVKEESEKKKRELAEKLNRSHYQEIFKLKGILPKSLYVLRIMKEKGVKNLTPPEIQFILRDVFGISENAAAISVALNRKRARGYTNRNRTVVGRTITYNYELMKFGEDYIEGFFKKKKNNHEDKTNEGEEPDLS